MYLYGQLLCVSAVKEVLAKSLVVMGFSGMVVGFSCIGLVTATG